MGNAYAAPKYKEYTRTDGNYAIVTYTGEATTSTPAGKVIAHEYRDGSGGYAFLLAKGNGGMKHKVRGESWMACWMEVMAKVA